MALSRIFEIISFSSCPGGPLLLFSPPVFRADLQTTLEWAAAGKLKPVIDSIFPLDQTAAAFNKLRSRNMLGKILIEPFEPESESD